ncbi:ABC transporter ATP-binding protein [Amycolatopsis sp. SID8362]|uniref:ABC transporter ATP-binding protein n=1 Tax=Amycolatopsis sp. SID8362 TaxID=2690346 RepID=UPI00136B46F3|nr:ABC transporter ATP-binding protein [Amycolatopsis sp. SID8362]NBH08570.1 ATP-binding cassette domain-containing protein [Amycolatopsis sp. SID8362]NED45264.1 ABC transporter ATP-binding protein [Amycolatopsis sp. SID8362]
MQKATDPREELRLTAATPHAPAIAVRDLHRIYAVQGRRESKQPPRVALDGISLTIPHGEVHGVLGPNGAGKTTLVKILSTALLPSSGSARVLGFDVVTEAAQVRARIGVALGGERGFHVHLTARQTLRFWAAMLDIPKALREDRCDAVLARFDLLDRADSPVHTYSRGMRQRLHLARALLPDPGMLFLDEPTIGVDPAARRDFRTLVSTLAADGKTIVLTTHDTSEAEQICDRVTLMDRGRILVTDSPAALSALFDERTQVDVEDADAPALDAVGRLPGVASVNRDASGCAHVRLTSSAAIRPVIETLLAHGAVQVRTVRPPLESVYLSLTERQAPEA